jgi:outer membrane biosynthesis protein TonB
MTLARSRVGHHRPAYSASRAARITGFAVVAAAHLCGLGLLWHQVPARTAIVAAAPVFVHILSLPTPPAEPPKPFPKPRPAIVPAPRPEPLEPAIELPQTPIAQAPTAITLPPPAPAPPVEVIAPVDVEVSPAPPVTPPRFDADYLRNPSPT